MIHGLMWLPLLALFFGLAWAGWNEYRKVEMYKQWALQFERAKYDIYAVLGQQANALTWGLPTRQGVVNSETLDLTAVRRLEVEAGGAALSDPKELLTSDRIKGRIGLKFSLADGRQLSVPFTDGAIAYRWYDFLQQRIENQAAQPS